MTWRIVEPVMNLALEAGCGFASIVILAVSESDEDRPRSI
jgi:hypothetical protein